jgi:hypothetical protein
MRGALGHGQDERQVRLRDLLADQVALAVPAQDSSACSAVGFLRGGLGDLVWIFQIR